MWIFDESNIMSFADDAKLYSRDINHPSTLHFSNLLIVWPAGLMAISYISIYCVISTCKVVSCQTKLIRQSWTWNRHLSFHAHISNIVAKALQRSSTFSGALSLSPRLHFSHTSVAGVHCVVWNTTQICLMNMIESVQQRFSQIIPSLPTHLARYTKRLNLGLVLTLWVSLQSSDVFDY